MVKDKRGYFTLDIEASTARVQGLLSKKNETFSNPFRRYLHVHSGSFIALLIIGLIGLLSISWFRGEYLISAGDFSMPLDRLRSFTANFYVWDSRSLGSANPRVCALTFPVWSYFAFSEIIGLSLSVTEQILFYGVFTIGGLSMYYLTITLLRNTTVKLKHLAGLISGIFYMLNPYVAITILPLRTTSFMIYALLPLILAIFVKGLNEKKNVKFAIIAAFVMLLATSMFGDPSYVPLTLLPLLMYLIFYVLVNPTKIAFFSALKFTAVFFLTWISLNLYWLIPDAYFSTHVLAYVTSSYSSMGVSFLSAVKLNSAPVIGAIRLLGYWGLNSGYRGDAYFIWASTYQTPLPIIVSFLLPFLVSIPLLMRPKDKHVLFFAFSVVISLLLINGAYSPVGNWIYSRIPLFNAFFDTPYYRFGMYLALTYAFLIGYTLTELFRRINHSLNRFRHVSRQILSAAPIIVILFLIVGVYAFPLWTGDVIRPGTQVIQSNRYQMPPYYQIASNWLATDQSDFNILILPLSTLGYAELKWANGGYDGPYPVDWLGSKAVIASSAVGNGIAGLAAQLIIDNQTTAASKILALMNVKYVLFQEDTNWLYVENNTSWISTSPDQFQSILSSSGALTLEKTFGQLLFYKNSYWQPEEVYSASTTILSDVDLNQSIQIAESDFNPNDSVIALSSQLSAQQISTLPMSTVFVQNHANETSIIYEKIQPTQYIVHVNSSKPFYLVFSESFDSGWVATINGQQIPDQDHFTANGYANGWYIDKAGTFTITLEFTPQNLFYAGAAISITSLIICTTYLSKNKITYVYKKHVKKDKANN